jgi:hydroxyacylglutathione hydrolase
MPDSLDDVAWIHGAPNCAVSTDPLLQVHQVDEDTFILRQSKCLSFEGNFMYLLFGQSRAILFDTGASADHPTPGKILPIRATVDQIIAQWLIKRGVTSVELIVAHTHSHGDHVFWDGQFVGRPHTTIVKHDVPGVKAFYSLQDWPEGRAVLDLGARQLIVMPLPGHEPSHIAAYDSRSQFLLTGDTLYAGLLTVQDWPAYLRSAARLAEFAAEHSVSRILGCHIEMKRTAHQMYPIPTTFQPDEHTLSLTVAHLEEWHAAVEAMGDSPHQDVHADFIIDPE